MSARIAFLGDTLLGGEADETLRRETYGYALEGILPLLNGVDLVVANHEGPLTNRAIPEAKADTGRKRYWYRGRPEAARALREFGVRVVSLANNHVLDFGHSGLWDTMQILDEAGIAHCGAGHDEREARLPAVISVAGLRIGFLSYMQRYDIYVRERLYATAKREGCARLRISRASEDLAALEGKVDLRVVLVHWGRNYRPVSRRQERLAATLRGAGADVIVGHHPHIPQRVDVAGGKPIFFSLGNGPLGTPGRFHSGRPPYGLLAVLEFDSTAELLAIELHLIEVDNAKVLFRPVAAKSANAAQVLRAIACPDGNWRFRGSTARLSLPRSRSGESVSGASDVDSVRVDTAGPAPL